MLCAKCQRTHKETGQTCQSNKSFLLAIISEAINAFQQKVSVFSSQQSRIFILVKDYDQNLINFHRIKTIYIHTLVLHDLDAIIEPPQSF